MKIIECPRDAMQGIKAFIPTKLKIQYLNQLLKVGFDTLDFGSFVSPKAIPQLQDTSDVIERLDLDYTYTKLLAIVANTRGAQEAAIFSQLSYLGYPLSVSETFQKKNTNKDINEAFETAYQIQNICDKSGTSMVCYISMGFGNPYGDPYNEEVVAEFIEKLVKKDIKIISLADTMGSADSTLIGDLFTKINNSFPDIELGVHLHSHPVLAKEKIEAAYQAGCRRFDGALNGIGGCPMAGNTLVGNIPTEAILSYLEGNNEETDIDPDELEKALKLSEEIFQTYY